MCLEAAALLDFSQLLSVLWVRNCNGGMYLSYSVVLKKRRILIIVVFSVCFLDWLKYKDYQLLSARLDEGPSGFSYADGLSDNSLFITTKLHHLAGYGEL